MAINGFGKMGRAVWEELGRDAYVVDPHYVGYDESNCIQNIQALPSRPTVIIDFSSPQALNELLSYAVDYGVPLVIATTGHTVEQKRMIEEASRHIPIYRSANTSASMPAFLNACRLLATRLASGYITVHEIHRQDKKDAPSGTAIMIADVLSQSAGKRGYILGDRKDADYVGITYERMGDVVGVHRVNFDCGQEKVTLEHVVTDRRVFARGAVLAAKFIQTKTSGLYGIEDIVDVR